METVDRNGAFITLLNWPKALQSGDGDACTDLLFSGMLSEVELPPPLPLLHLRGAQPACPCTYTIAWGRRTFPEIF